MTKYLKQMMIRGLIGIMIGLSLGYTVVLIMTLTNGSYTFDGKILMINYLYAILVGFYMAAVTIVFDVEEWSLLRQTIIHGLLNCPYIIVAYIIGWAPTGTFLRVVFVLVYIAVYAIIWLSFRYYWSKKAVELNETLKKLKTDC